MSRGQRPSLLPAGLLRRSFSALPSHTIVPMPALSPTMETGSIAKWILKEGDKFEPGNAICEVETDKATVTFDAQDEGYLAKILVGSGDIKVGQPIMVTVDDAANVAAFSSFKLEGVAAAASAAAPVAPAAAKPVAAAPAKAVVAASPPSSSSDDGSRVVASPFARKLARDNGVDIALLKGKGSGPNGRIVAADIANAPALLSASKAAGAAKTAVGKAVSTKGSSTGSVYEDFELSDLSRALADRFTKSKVHVPHYYLSVELNLAKLLELRQQLNSDNKADDGCSVSVLDLLVKATGLAVKQVPDVNGSWNESFIRRYTQVDINLVMGAGASVVTPVIRNVNTKGLRQITSEIAGFEDNLFREDKTSGAFSTIDPSALAPGTFSIHNLGMFGVKSAAPIILPPQACALAFGAVVDSVVPRAGAGDNWEVAPVMVATLSCDHRVIDGAVGAQWLGAFKTIVENPASLLL